MHRDAGRRHFGHLAFDRWIARRDEKAEPRTPSLHDRSPIWISPIAQNGPPLSRQTADAGDRLFDIAGAEGLLQDWKYVPGILHTATAVPGHEDDRRALAPQELRRRIDLRSGQIDVEHGQIEFHGGD